MYIRLKVFTADTDFLAYLKDNHVRAHLMGKAIVIKPFYYTAVDGSDREIYTLPLSFLEGYKYAVRMNAAEVGRGWAQEGSGSVICDLKGRALRPYSISRVGRLPVNREFYKVYASFSSAEDLVEISGEWSAGYFALRIDSFHLVVEGEEAWIESQPIWSGILDQFYTDGLDYFRPAVNALVEMSTAQTERQSFY